MPGRIQDLRHVIRHHLANDDGDLGDLVEGRVFTQHLTDEDATTVLEDGPLLVTAFRAGRLHYNQVVQATVFELWAYSRTSADEAARIYDLATDVLQAERLTVTGTDPAVVCQETLRPHDGWNRNLRAWFLEGRWLARATA